MRGTLAPPTGIVVIAVVLSAVLIAVIPTCLYLYVEPRGRRSWAAANDAGVKRRAPPLVRWTAWLSFAVGQLALPWLLVPGACAVLVYLQAKLGVGRGFGWVATVFAGTMAIAQFLLALRLLPLGVRLLARDASLVTRVAHLARRNAMANAMLAGLALAMSFAMASAPGLVHPWLRAVLSWTALRPVIAYAALGLVHALMLGQCGRFLADGPPTPRVR